MLQKKIHRVFNTHNGFAMIDVLVGITIITIALLGIALAYRQSTVTTVSARNYNQATYYAQQALEQLKVHDGKTAASVPVTTWATNANIVKSGAMPAFTLTTAVLAAGDAPEYDGLSQGVRDKLIPVRATVTWQETSGGGNTNRSVVVIGYYYLK